jgi:hypothetical protein
VCELSAFDPRKHVLCGAKADTVKRRLFSPPRQILRKWLSFSQDEIAFVGVLREAHVLAERKPTID